MSASIPMTCIVCGRCSRSSFSRPLDYKPRNCPSIRDVYGPYAAETMLKSVAARIVFAPKDYPDAKEISDELGFTTVRVRSHSKPNFMAFNRQSGRSGSSTVSQQARALLLPQEVEEIGKDNALIFYEG